MIPELCHLYLYYHHKDLISNKIIFTDKVWDLEGYLSSEVIFQLIHGCILHAFTFYAITRELEAIKVAFCFSHILRYA